MNICICIRISTSLTFVAMLRQMLNFQNSFSFGWKWVKFQVSIWHYSANYYSDFNLLAIGFHRNWKSSRDCPWRLKGNLHGEVWTEGKSPQQICWRLDAAGKSPVFHLFLCMAWWEIYKLHWCKQIPSVSAKDARSSIEKLFYFTRISEDKCNESLEATLTHTPSIILWVIAGYTVGWLCVDENTLQLKKTFEVGAESAILVLVLSVCFL